MLVLSDSILISYYHILILVYFLFCIMLTVDKLTKKIMLLTNEKRKAERNISSLQVDSEILKKRCKEAELESSTKISKEEMAKQIEYVKR